MGLGQREEPAAGGWDSHRDKGAAGRVDQLGEMRWRGEAPHPSVLPPEPQVLLWAGDVRAPVSNKW